MNKISILSVSYYTNDEVLEVREINKLFEDKIPSSILDTQKLNEKFPGTTYQNAAKQTLAMQACIAKFKNKDFYESISSEEISVSAGSLTSSLYPATEFILSSRKKGPNFVSVTAFPNTVANATASRICILNQFKNNVVCISEGLNSGVNAIMLSCDQIKHGKTKYSWALSSEENSAAAFFLGNSSESLKTSLRPLAYIKNYDSRYLGNLDKENISNYLKNILSKWKIDTEYCHFYLNHNYIFDFLNNSFSIKNKKSHPNSNLFSVAPMLEIGRAICGFKDVRIKNSVIISYDERGMISTVELER